MISCVTHEDTGEVVLVLYPQIKCWHGYHLLHAAFSLIIAPIFLLIAVVVSLTYFESKQSSNSVDAKVNSRAETKTITMKFLMIYVYAFLYDESYHWFIIALLLILSYMSYSSYKTQWPFYDDFMNRFFSVLLGIFVWCNICLLAVKLLEHTIFDGGLQIFFLGLPIVVACIAFDKDERIFILMKSINNF